MVIALAPAPHPQTPPQGGLRTRARQAVMKLTAVVNTVFSHYLLTRFVFATQTSLPDCHVASVAPYAAACVAASVPACNATYKQSGYSRYAEKHIPAMLKSIFSPC